MPTIAEVAEIFMRAEGLTTIGTRAGVKATYPLGVMAAVLAALGRGRGGAGAHRRPDHQNDEENGWQSHA